MAVIGMICSAGFASADDSVPTSEELLLATYHRISSRLETSSFGLPLFLDSFEQGHNMHVDVYGIFTYAFDDVVAALNVPSNWCDIVSLHANVKACTHQEEAGAWSLTFYLGRKTPQPLADTRRVLCRYENVVQNQGYQDIVLVADQGPLGTKDHRMRFEALPLEGGRTFVHVSYSYSDSAALRLATRIYFATLGRNKVGFTVIGTNENQEPVYIGGPRGAVERNALRSYFAIQSFLDTAHSPPEGRFGQRINRWYDLTNSVRAQLFDLEREDYLQAKRAEHTIQVRLQRQRGVAVP